MKKCPNCQKEFPDAMRFCQSDGTMLVEVVEEIQSEDHLKTTVVRQDEIASLTPPPDPFRTMVVSQIGDKEEEDILQLPQEYDPLKTMIAQPDIRRDTPILENVETEAPNFEAIKEEIKAEAPPILPSEQISMPFPPADPPIKSPFEQPPSPKFDEPGMSPPVFWETSDKKNLADEEELPATIVKGAADVGNFPQSESPLSFPGEPFVPQSGRSEPPFAKQDETPVSQPVDVPKPEFKSSPFGEKPQTPFGMPPNPPSPFESPSSPFQSTPFGPPQKTMQETPNQFGSSPFSQVNEPFASQPFQQVEWSPPPAPVAGWQEQSLGTNTPFQPPVAGSQSQTLAIVSLICGVISVIGVLGYIIPVVNLVCAALNFLLGIGAIVAGVLARSRAAANPEQYGGAGLAMGGIISGAIGFLLVIGWGILVVISLSRFF